MGIRSSMLLSVALLSCVGCRTLRFDIGVGFGFGWGVKIPAVLHTGFGGGKYYRVGYAYAQGWHAGTGDEEFPLATEQVVFFWHDYSARDRWWEVSRKARRSASHRCWLVPAAWEPDDPDSYALEIRVCLLFLEITLGFNPYYLFHDKPPPEVAPTSEPQSAKTIPATEVGH